ncbi:RnfG1 [Desulforapulum autotrophicum HRM2]|uniref:Ion-translocating oxidoreductase complex subunit G n=1 Tax=Desulforapulum autotrophicum (strain ATCC 43914 / DSM 3382 / VKM B-1955 / HRM2) TaxID=177437 RepID=C0QFQ6_DESAH|nr:FMN-binding protein [Desulforapulum autotrophicum]ACN15474.1 RnfG1 [Desulforapulum autotrophicum HRM2]
MKSFFQTNLGQAWLVLLLALIFGSSLAGVQAALGPRIEDNKLKETLEKVPVVILGQTAADDLAAKGEPLTITPNTVSIDKNGITKFYTLYRADYADGTTAGWVAKSSGQGYADKIELLVGMDGNAQKVTGLFILDQKETPGLGNRIVEDEWRAQFSGLSTDTPFKVVKIGKGGVNEIDAISGATISSRSVTKLVNQAVSDLKPQVAQLKTSGKKGEK